MKLILCAGKTKREGWITLDANRIHEPDILAKIPPLPQEITAEKWDEIELVHGITSFYPWEAEQLLRELRDVLAPDGKLILEQPNLDKCWGKLEWIFGDPLLREPLHMNRWAYNPSSLMAMVLAAGFGHCNASEAQYHHPERDFRVEAW